MNIRITDNIVLIEEDKKIKIVEHEREYESVKHKKGKWLYVSYKFGEMGELRKYIRTIYEKDFNK